MLTIRASSPKMGALGKQSLEAMPTIAVRELIRVGRVRGKQEEGVICVPCDRSSVLGNPFDMGYDEKSRDPVCDAFGGWLKENIRLYQRGKSAEHVILRPWLDQGLTIAPAFKNPSVFTVCEELRRIGGLVAQGRQVALLCHCHPKRCHVLSIVNAIEWQLG